ncbi:oligopeptide transport system substrate-binding protein [Streptacidiphilus sp. MAP12-16]|uniref:peptide ABC transporter substrate-binding protein n=1 Tax=Streptacidiphilus sp. MAP12-16 TaxID=3156300 RepID=UPI003515D9E8
MRGATRAKFAAGAIVIALAATACSSSGSSSSGSSGSNTSGVVSAWWGDPQNPLIPTDTNEVNGGAVLNMIFTGLKGYDPKTGQPFNAMASSITTTDQQNFTITLKSGWTFSDGTPVTASSYVDAWNYGSYLPNKQNNTDPFFTSIQGYTDVHPASGTPKVKTMSGLKVVNATTFTVALTHKFSTWPDTLGYSAFYPLPQAFFSNPTAWLAKPVGNGPYVINSWTKSQQMQLRPNPTYAGTNKAQNGGINLKVYTDPNAAYADLQSGNLDVDNGLPNSALKTVSSDLNGRYINQPAGIIQTISFPMYQAAWNTANAKLVRQGISMAIDRPTITKQIFNNSRTPASDWTSPVLGAAGGYQSGICGDACTYNPTKAKQLITQGGGLPGGQLTISYNADGPHKEWVDAVCNSINNAMGNTTACVGKPVGTFADFRNQVTNKTETSAFRTGWQMDYPLIQDFLQPLYYTNAASNDSHYSNPQFDGLVDQANAQGDTTKAIGDFQSAEKLLATDLPAIPLWYQNGTAGWSSKVSNVTLDPFSVPVYTNITVNK